MAKNKVKAPSELVDEYIGKLEPTMAELTNALRKVILSADKEIGEQIKWNVPAFFYAGEMKPFDPKEYKRDMVVLNFRQKGHILLVLPSGAKVEDDSGLLEGDYSDGRRMIKIVDKKDLLEKEKSLQLILKKWLLLLDKR